jgi:hypothetical protein
VIAADNDAALFQDAVVAKGREAAQATGAELMVRHFSDEEMEAGLADLDDLASDSLSQAAAVREQPALSQTLFPARLQQTSKTANPELLIDVGQAPYNFEKTTR